MAWPGSSVKKPAVGRKGYLARSAATDGNSPPGGLLAAAAAAAANLWAAPEEAGVEESEAAGAEPSRDVSVPNMRKNTERCHGNSCNTQDSQNQQVQGKKQGKRSVTSRP